MLILFLYQEGKKQRVAIASAVASEKKIIVFDEPTSGLDLKHMKEAACLLHALLQTGKSLFIISHDLEFVLEICTFVVHLENGRIKYMYNINNDGLEKLKKAFLRNGNGLV
jgi:energy-coupling factor transport system ATP-binding protein